jgi:hypothetical protein
MQLSEVIYNPQLFIRLDLAAQQACLEELGITTRLIAPLISFVYTREHTYFSEVPIIEYYNIDQAFFIEVPSR